MSGRASPLLERLSLTRQVWAGGTLASATLAALVALAAARSDAAWPAWAVVLGAGAATTAVAAWTAARVVRAHDTLARGARGVARDAPAEPARGPPPAPALVPPATAAGTGGPLPDAPGSALPPSRSEIPLLRESADAQDAALALRRAVEALRARIEALAAHNAALAAQLSTRTQALVSLQDLSIGLARHGDIGSLVDEALRALEQTIAFSSASVWARAELDPSQPVMLLGYRSSASELNGLALADLAGLRLSRANLQRYEQIERDGEPIIENRPRTSLLAWLWAMVTDDARTSALYRSTRAWMAVPLKVRERVLGVLRVDHVEPDHFDAERVRLLQAVAGQTALAMRHAHLMARERDQAVLAERNRLARDLHDAVSQTLFAANLVAGTLARDPALPGAAAQQVHTLERLNAGALAEMRMLMFELRPDALEGARLAELLQHASAALAARGEVAIEIDIDAAEPPPAQRIEVYRIAQEALSNVARHSGARHVQLQWKLLAPGRGRLAVRDDGHGFDSDQPHPGHFGLGNMRERAAALGGTFELTSAPGQGTSVALEVQWS